MPSARDSHMRSSWCLATEISWKTKLVNDYKLCVDIEVIARPEMIPQGVTLAKMKVLGPMRVVWAQIHINEVHLVYHYEVRELQYLLRLNLLYITSKHYA